MNLINQTLLEQFRVDAFIQAGGMGSVYRVWDLKRSAALAMKVLHADLAEDPLVLARFQREASVLQTLAHPHIVPFYGLMQGPGFSFLLERFIDGPSLKEILAARRGAPLPPAEALTYLKAMSSALGYAHNSGIVHCDVKPANVLLDRGGSIFLTDFGIARFADTTATTLRAVGTPAYMAPEQITAQQVSPATDVYALGVVLFEMLTGQKPFRGSETIFDTLPNAGQTTAERVRYAHLCLPPPDPRSLNPAIAPDLAQVILTALSKTPAERFRATLAFFNAACGAAGLDPAALPERVSLPPEVLAMHAAGGAATGDQPVAPTIAPEIVSPPAPPPVPGSAFDGRSQPGAPISSWPPAPTIAPTTIGYPPAGSPPNPGYYPYPPAGGYPPQAGYAPSGGYPPISRRGLPLWAIALIVLGVLAVIALALAALNGAPKVTPTAEPPQITSTLTPTSEQPVAATLTPSLIPSHTPPGPLTETPTPIQPTPALSMSVVRIVGGDWATIYAQADWNSQIVTSLPDGTPVWVTGMQSYDGFYAYAEIFYENNGSFLLGWVLLDYLPDEPNWVITATPTSVPDSVDYLLAYVSGLDGAWQITLNDWNGSTWALPNQPANSGVPAWSPDHQWLAFRSSASGSWQVYKIRPDGSELTQLTFEGNNYEPNWSPDGGQIVFVSDRDGNKELYLMYADGSGQTRLTENPDVDDDPSFSPWGDTLVFESKRNDHMDVYWMDLSDIANPIQVTSGGAYNGTPAWSPNGDYILFEREEDGETHLWLIETSTWNISQFWFSGSTNHRPAWSWDGNYVAYTSDESGDWRVHVLDFYDGVSSPVTSDLSYDPATGW